MCASRPRPSHLPPAAKHCHVASAPASREAMGPKQPGLGERRTPSLNPSQSRGGPASRWLPAASQHRSPVGPTRASLSPPEVLSLPSFESLPNRGRWGTPCYSQLGINSFCCFSLRWSLFSLQSLLERAAPEIAFVPKVLPVQQKDVAGARTTRTRNWLHVRSSTSPRVLRSGPQLTG